MKTHSLKLCALGLLVVCLWAVQSQVYGQDTKRSISWRAFQDPDYGATLYYPAELFQNASQFEGGYLFLSKDKQTRLFFKSFLDPLRAGAGEMVRKLKTGKGAHRIIELQSGAMWLEMKGASEPDNLVFMKVIYSCKERVVSQFSLSYPKKRSAQYEPLLQKMRKRFQAGVGAKTPIRECN